jgi:NADH dehydrogenase
VGPDLTVPRHPEVYAVGDMALVLDRQGRPLPGVAPVAMQQGTYAGRAVARRVQGLPSEGPFRYVDKGTLATIGRAKAIADIKGVKVWGFPAWALWLLVHLTYLIGFQNRLLVLLRWAFSFVTRGRGSRIITDDGARSGP